MIVTNMSSAHAAAGSSSLARSPAVAQSVLEGDEGERLHAVDLVVVDGEGLHGDHVEDHADAGIAGEVVGLDVALGPVMDEQREGRHQTLLLVDDQGAARPDLVDAV